jgi:hypothetical protein
MQTVKLGNFFYIAINDGGTTWMVRRYTHEPVDTNETSARDDSEFTEALINLETSDTMTVILEAIARGSWG